MMEEDTTDWLDPKSIKRTQKMSHGRFLAYMEILMKEYNFQQPNTKNLYPRYWSFVKFLDNRIKDLEIESEKDPSRNGN